MIDYIYNKFLIGFECYDEDEFWERIDEDLLITIFERNKEEIDGFSNSLEMIPPFDGETMEDYVMGLAANTNDCVQDINPELPSLSIEDKNQFKQIKIGLEHGGFFGKEGSTISPEIEGQFLDYVIEFEKQFKDAKRVSSLLNSAAGIPLPNAIGFTCSILKLFVSSCALMFSIAASVKLSIFNELRSALFNKSCECIRAE